MCYLHYVKTVSMIRKCSIMRKSHIAIAIHQEEKQSKTTSSLFPIKMIAKLEWTQSNAQQNMEQLQNPTMGVTINNESIFNNRTTALERKAAKASGGLNVFYWYQIFALDSAVVEAHKNVKLAWRIPNYCNVSS